MFTTNYIRNTLAPKPNILVIENNHNFVSDRFMILLPALKFFLPSNNGHCQRSYCTDGKSPIYSYSVLQVVAEEMKAFQSNPDPIQAVALIKAHGQKGNIGTVKTIYQTILQANKQNAFVFNTTISAFAKSEKPEQVLDVLNDMQKSKVSLTPVTVNILLSMLGRTKNLEIAQRALQQLRDSPEILFNNVDCTKLIQVFTTHSKPQLALELLNLIEKRNMIPDEITYTALLSAAANFGDSSFGKRIYSNMLKCQVVLSPALHNGLLNMYAMCGQFDTASSIFSTSLDDITAWNIMIKAYSKQHKEQLALDLFNKMPAHIKPDHITYTTLVTACASLGNIATGKLFHEQILKSSIKPTLELQSAIINMFCQFNDLDTAWNLFLQLLDQPNLEPSARTYTCLVAACANRRDLVRGKQLHADISKRGVKLDVYLLTALLNLYHKCGANEMIIDLFCQAKQTHLTLNSTAYTTLLAACAAQRNLALGEEIHQDIIANSVPQTLEMHTALIQLYINSGKADIAWNVFQQLNQLPSGCKPDAIMYACLLNAVGKNNLLDGKKLHQDLVAEQIPITPALQIALIKMYCQGNDFQTAKTILESFDHSLPEIKNAYTSAFAACADSGNIYIGKQLHESFMKKGVLPDVPLQTDLISMYAKAGEHATVKDLYKQMKQNELEPNAITYMCLLSSCAQQGDIILGRELHQEISAKKIPVTIELHTALISMYGKSGMKSYL